MDTIKQIKILQDIERRNNTLIGNIKSANAELDGHIRKMAAAHLNVDYTTIIVTSAGHSCKESPTGMCIYETIDFCRDDCVICGEPDERK